MAPFPGGSIEIDEETFVSSTGALSLKKVPERLVVIGWESFRNRKSGKKIVRAADPFSLSLFRRRCDWSGAGLCLGPSRRQCDGGRVPGQHWRRWYAFRAMCLCSVQSAFTQPPPPPSLSTGMDGEIAKNFQRILKKQGMNFKLGTKVTGAVKQADGTVKVQLENKKGKTEELDAGGCGVDAASKHNSLKSGPKSHNNPFYCPPLSSADVVLVCVGRRPYTANLGLENVGIALDERGRVDVNDRFQTSVPNIYAIGDCIKGPMLAHKAEDGGCVERRGATQLSLVPKLIFPFFYVWFMQRALSASRACWAATRTWTTTACRRLSTPTPRWPGLASPKRRSRRWFVFFVQPFFFLSSTHGLPPPSSSFFQGIEYNKGVFNMSANSRAKCNADEAGLVKVLSDKTTDRILGVHMIGSVAGELINEAVLAVEYGASAEDVARVCHAHPVGETYRLYLFFFLA